MSLAVLRTSNSKWLTRVCRCRSGHRARGRERERDLTHVGDSRWRETALGEIFVSFSCQRRNVALLVLQRWLRVPKCARNHSSPDARFAVGFCKNVRICLLARHEADEMETME